MVWNRDTVPNSGLQSPDGCGWKLDDDEFVPMTTKQLLAPNAVLRLVVLSRQPSSRQAARGLVFQEISTVAVRACVGRTCRLTSARRADVIRSLSRRLSRREESSGKDCSESTCSLDVRLKRLNFCIYSIENRLKRSSTIFSVFIDDGALLVESIVRHPPTHDHS